MVIAAVITALCVVGRFIPFFKPIAALTIIAAVYLGGETGFMVGAMAALMSNFYFGQGPWTPFQMLAWGMIGLIAGYFLQYNGMDTLASAGMGGIAYPLMVGSCIVGFSLYSVVVMREKNQWQQYLAFALCLGGMICLCAV